MTKALLTAAIFAATLVAAQQVSAQIPSQGVISACVRMDRDGDEARLMRLVAANEGCRRNETRISWSQAGPQGPMGLVGPQGPAGSAGATGPAGPAGPTGLTGPQGPAGSTGLTGTQGPAGPAGQQGPAGPAGSVGPQGLQGPAGTDGSIGPQGSQGVQGDPGPKGDKGDPGPGAAQSVFSGDTSSPQRSFDFTATNLPVGKYVAHFTSFVTLPSADCFIGGRRLRFFNSQGSHGGTIAVAVEMRDVITIASTSAVIAAGCTADDYQIWAGFLTFSPAH